MESESRLVAIGMSGRGERGVTANRLGGIQVIMKAA